MQRSGIREGQPVPAGNSRIPLRCIRATVLTSSKVTISTSFVPAGGTFVARALTEVAIPF